MTRPDPRANRDARPRVVIVGGGFAGLYAARALAGAAAEVTLVDRRNHHLFQPLLYQVATAGLSTSDIAAPIRRVLRAQDNVTVLLGEVTRVDVAAREVRLGRDDVLRYDYLVLAPGSVTSYFGHDEWERHAPGLKSVEDAVEVRRRVLLAFERAERETDEARRTRDLRFVVVGAGPTGVELAGALREIAQRTLARDFRRFDPATAEVVLLDAADRVLPTFPDELSREAAAELVRMGVRVRTDERVESIDGGGVTLDSGEHLDAGTVLWAAGVTPSPLVRDLPGERTRDGRVVVANDLSLPGHPEVFVVGDAAAVRRPDGELVPGMAPGAIQMGRHAARTIRRELAGAARAPFRYRDRGLLATIGRSSAVAEVAGRRFHGFLAWALWVFVHVFWLIGFRARLVVLIEWAWAWVTWQRSARVIVAGPVRPDRGEHSG